MTRDVPPGGLSLIERADGFAYGYRMKCSCGRLSDLSAGDYAARERIDAMMKCAFCNLPIHYGPAVAGIRDEDDPALDNEILSQFAWYHTSTAPDWPAADFAHQLVLTMAAAEMRLGYRFDSYIVRETSKALHLGTYEAAIENMLRRMDDQSDASSQFYLYRVGIEVESRRVNIGYRDENHENAAQLGLADLGREGLDAVRYLNTHEAVGTLSLAIHPRILRSLQVIAVPTNDGTRLNSSNLTRMAAFDAELRELQGEAEAWAHVLPGQLRMMQLGARPDPDGIGASSRANDQRTYMLWQDAEGLLANRYLSGVSPIVQDRFKNAINSWRADKSPTAVAFAHRFVQMAMLLTTPREIIRKVSAQPARPVMHAESTS